MVDINSPLVFLGFVFDLAKILILDVGLCISASTTTHPDVCCEKTLLKHSVKAQKIMEMEPFFNKAAGKRTRAQLFWADFDDLFRRN